MEILLILISILVMYLIIRSAVHEGTLKALKEFDDYIEKKEQKNKID